MNTDRAATLAKHHLTRLLVAAVKADDLTSARGLLQSLEHLKTASETIRSSVDEEFKRWGLTEAERELVQNPNQYINAIKEVRTRTGLGLREAKDKVDAYREHLYRTNVLARPARA
jgi:ribosomal protein L7/L12